MQSESDLQQIVRIDVETAIEAINHAMEVLGSLSGQPNLVKAGEALCDWMEDSRKTGLCKGKG